MTTRSPEAPKTLSSIREWTAALAASRVSAMTTPLPRARPSAFTTMGRLQVSR